MNMSTKSLFTEFTHGSGSIIELNHDKIKLSEIINCVFVQIWLTVDRCEYLVDSYILDRFLDI